MILLPHETEAANARVREHIRAFEQAHGYPPAVLYVSCFFSLSLATEEQSPDPDSTLFLLEEDDEDALDPPVSFDGIPVEYILAYGSIVYSPL